MITPREDFGTEYINELIADWGDEPRLVVCYEQAYFGPDHPNNRWEIELVFIGDREDLAIWGAGCRWLVPGSTEEVLADCEEW